MSVVPIQTTPAGPSCPTTTYEDIIVSSTGEKGADEGIECILSYFDETYFISNPNAEIVDINFRASGDDYWEVRAIIDEGNDTDTVHEFTIRTSA